MQEDSPGGSDSLTFVSPPGKILRNFTADIARSAPASLARPVTVHVGLHVRALDAPQDGALGLQTEQFFDQAGNPLWGLKAQAQVLRNLAQVEMLVDFSDCNWPAYRDLPADLRRKVVFGPYLFPAVAPDYRPGDGPLQFFGNMGERREAAIAAVRQHSPVEIAGRGTFGDVLEARVRDARAVLNVHFADAVYTEYPRLLSAFLMGKAVASEPLAAPLVPHRHYAPADRPVSAEAAAEAYAGMADFARGFGFGAFLTAFAAGTAGA